MDIKHQSERKLYSLFLQIIIIAHIAEWAYSRCGGISLTLISLAELGVMLRGLYFFSTGGASVSDVLNKQSQSLMIQFQTLRSKTAFKS